MNKISSNINHKFSFFRQPVTNIKPYKDIIMVDVYNVINGEYYKKQTDKLRLITDVKENRKFKATYFPYCTFSGTFTQRSSNTLIEHSGYIAIDFDHLDDVQSVKMQLLKDNHFETELIYVSPNGNGLKWVIQIDRGYSHDFNFNAIYNYIRETYRIEIDKACKDVARASFLCYDPTVWIHPKYMIK